MKDIPTSPRIAQMKRRRRIGRIRMAILLAVLFFSILGFTSYFSSNSKVTINKIVITGNSILDGSDLESSIDKNINGKYLKLFDKSNFLFYPKQTIYNNLFIEFPRIEKLSIKLEGFNTLRVEIGERSGSFLYCGESLPLDKSEIGENCYFVNNDGYVFDNAPYFSGDVYFKFYMKISDKSVDPLGIQMISPDKFHNIVRFIDGVSSLGFKPSYIVLSKDGLYSLYLKSNNDGVFPRVIFKEGNDFSVILDNLASAMKQKEFANEINSKYDTLSYIDLRFKNKVLYKFE